MESHSKGESEVLVAERGSTTLFSISEEVRQRSISPSKAPRPSTSPRSRPQASVSLPNGRSSTSKAFTNTFSQNFSQTSSIETVSQQALVVENSPHESIENNILSIEELVEGEVSKFRMDPNVKQLGGNDNHAFGLNQLTSGRKEVESLPSSLGDSSEGKEERDHKDDATKRLISFDDVVVNNPWAKDDSAKELIHFDGVVINNPWVEDE